MTPKFELYSGEIFVHCTKIPPEFEFLYSTPSSQVSST